MAIDTPFIVPAAQAFCATHEHVLCGVTGTAEAILTPDRASFLNAIAIKATRNYRDDAGDAWIEAGPDTPGDCEDKVLWAAQEIVRRYADLAGSIQVVAFRTGDEAHVVLAVYTDRGVFIVDGFNYSAFLIPRADLPTRSGYPGKAFSPESGVGGRWIPLEPQAAPK